MTMRKIYVVSVCDNEGAMVPITAYETQEEAIENGACALAISGEDNRAWSVRDVDFYEEERQ